MILNNYYTEYCKVQCLVSYCVLSIIASGIARCLWSSQGQCIHLRVYISLCYFVTWVSGSVGRELLGSMFSVHSPLRAATHVPFLCVRAAQN